MERENDLEHLWLHNSRSYIWCFPWCTAIASILVPQDPNRLTTRSVKYQLSVMKSSPGSGREPQYLVSSTQNLRSTMKPTVSTEYEHVIDNIDWKTIWAHYHIMTGVTLTQPWPRPDCNLTPPWLHPDSALTPPRLHPGSTLTPSWLHTDSTLTPSSLRLDSTLTQPIYVMNHTCLSVPSSSIYCTHSGTWATTVLNLYETQLNFQKTSVWNCLMKICALLVSLYE